MSSEKSPQGGDELSKLPTNDQTPPSPEDLQLLQQLFHQEITEKHSHPSSSSSFLFGHQGGIHSSSYSLNIIIEICFVSLLFLFLYSSVIDRMVFSFGIYRPPVLFCIKLVLFILLYVAFRKIMYGY